MVVAADARFEEPPIGRATQGLIRCGEIVNLCSAPADTWTDSMATDECLGAQAQGRESVLIQNGDWRGIFPQPTKNIAARAISNSGVSPIPCRCGAGNYALLDTSGEMVTLYL